MRSLASLTAILSISAITAFGQAPVTVVSYAGFNAQAPVAPGSIASAYGNFGNITTTVVPGNQLNPMPRTLAGVVVRVNNVDAPLYFVSSLQINFNIPVGTPTGRHPVQVVVNGTVVAQGTVNVYDFFPALAARTVDPTRPGAIANSDGSENLNTPIARGGIILLFATGCGATNPPQTDGTPPTQTSNVVGTVTAFVASVQAEVLGAAASPQFPGICQINIRIPDRPFITGPGPVPLSISVNGVPSNDVSVRVQ